MLLDGIGPGRLNDCWIWRGLGPLCRIGGILGLRGVGASAEGS
jgi:hypothetical protein